MRKRVSVFPDPEAPRAIACRRSARWGKVKRPRRFHARSPMLPPPIIRDRDPDHHHAAYSIGEAFGAAGTLLGASLRSLDLALAVLLLPPEQARRLAATGLVGDLLPEANHGDCYERLDPDGPGF